MTILGGSCCFHSIHNISNLSSQNVIGLCDFNVFIKTVNLNYMARLYDFSPPHIVRHLWVLMSVLGCHHCSYCIDDP